MRRGTLAQRRLELARLVHLAHDVAAADQLAVREQLRDRRPVRQRPDLRAEDVVNETVLLDAAAAREGRRGDGRAEVIAAPRVVLYLRSRAGDRRLDALLDLLRRGHSPRVYPLVRASPATIRGLPSK